MICGAESGLTPDEQEVTDLAGRTASAFAALPEMHPSDLPDVVFHVHAIQSAVMGRAAMRAHPDLFPMKGSGLAANRPRDHVVVLQPAEPAEGADDV